MSVTSSIRATIHLPGAVATWVLGAHAFALLVPVGLCVAVSHHWAFLAGSADYPALLYVAACLMAAGSAFEVAQNAIDQWYLTPEVASANGRSFCDLLFYWLVTAGQAVTAIAFAGGSGWVLALAALCVLAMPALYLGWGAHHAALGFSGLLAAAAAWMVLGDAVVWLQPLMAGVTMYFFNALLRTGAQWLHGLTTAAASSGPLVLVWALDSAADDARHGFGLVLGVVVAALLAGALLWPALRRLRPSPRVTAG